MIVRLGYKDSDSSDKELVHDSHMQYCMTCEIPFTVANDKVL